MPVVVRISTFAGCIRYEGVGRHAFEGRERFAPHVGGLHASWDRPGALLRELDIVEC
jgi:hypothetical protein